MSKQKNWHNLESGQALMEYWPTIPAAIMIIISAGLIVSFLRGAFTQTADVLERSSTGVSIEVCETTEEEISDVIKEVGTHTIELISVEYDEETDTTSVVYKLTSSEKHSISHWVLGLPLEFEDYLLSTSEGPTEWMNPDPTTGAIGLKFDKGYEGGGEEGGEAEEGEEEEGKKKGGKKDKHKTLGRHLAKLYLLQEETTTTISVPDGESREIGLLLSGLYEFQQTTVTTKSANNTATTSILAPAVRIIDNGHTETVITQGCD